MLERRKDTEQERVTTARFLIEDALKTPAKKSGEFMVNMHRAGFELDDFVNYGVYPDFFMFNFIFGR